MSRAITAGAFALALAAAGCTPIVTTHGYAPAPEQLAQIQPGVDTPQTVARKIGRPLTGGVLRDDAWYYASSRFETVGAYPPRVTDRRVVVVRFGPDGFVQGVETYGLEDGRVINLVTRTTPTYGRELTVLQQLFGNLGNVGATATEAGLGRPGG
ncbi:outer membrane protein assembly factor BamE domain-containing protein [Oceanicella actignis]|uniref:outer membrane protein assembly factor BamE domain-containing protein n=1 Tax=Oceanicella actignis TaxID=1189325 RepID=UPI001258F0D7|nr:outer membrane protein assembly factor BamE [Oceanicella actignis]TYO91580.1 outer membrane protein assembly factor BamE (lipoprotein component of BamABCDE complex) [Oceanicella actignis]